MGRSHRPRKHGETQPQSTSGAAKKQESQLTKQKPIAASENASAANVTSTGRGHSTARDNSSSKDVGDSILSRHDISESQPKKEAVAPTNRFILTPASQRNRSAKERADLASASQSDQKPSQDAQVKKKR